MANYRQLIRPTPLIKAKSGWCLQYVRQAFGLDARYPTATAAWANSTSQHRDRSFPKGVWFPVHWSIDTVPAGHIALVAPDGRVYSTSDLDPTPIHIHPNVADVESYYARHGLTLRYRGWTEDVAGTPVIARIEAKDELDMADPQDVVDGVLKTRMKRAGGRTGTTSLEDVIRYYDANHDKLIKQDAAQSAQIAGLVGAVAALAKGQTFDQAKLLAGIQAAAQAGAEQGFANAIEAIDTTVDFK